MGRKDIPETEREKLKKKFKGMMRALYRQEGAMLDVEVLRESEVLDFIDAHAAVLDSTFDKVKMSDGMRLSLQKSDWIFSGMKTFHELHEAFPSLLDEHGERKPFERFYNDVRKVDETYNRNYLRAEYNFATASAEMAAKWEQYERDGDRYYLQYRTVGDNHVREEHAAINGTTLPVSHPFWDTHYPPNGWNCRCLVVQVRKSSHEQTSEEELSKRTKALAEQQVKSKGKSEMFRFNPGKQRKVFPDYNPYTIKRCNDCDLARGKYSLTFMPSNEACAGCKILRDCFKKEGKSRAAIIQKHYLYKMQRLKGKTYNLDANGKNLPVIFDNKRNQHLYHDAIAVSKILQRDDLEYLDELLARAKYCGESDLTHNRKDNFKYFYYFEAELHGGIVRINVGKMLDPDTKTKRKRYKYIVYSINDKEKKKRRG
nr:MAG TPA: minor capsid component [Caudoviricetes sp.]